ncbi:DUF3352 domain-containing protein [Phycicoccus sp. SLBN-51]|jgi:hypothetical protein|uniref:DUF3352 domain-containing protein n=1 Tax=Phycicoccus sp. SLBN-51 TaxID=2768447 RepID=UPI001172F6F1|nr:DUF3352 domain-containing protein [Phycicoccus sp. SLBN-51]TQJ48804.1 uncharacterized protein DUF3352 [Phycicoccus sp. SLBN-51]
MDQLVMPDVVGEPGQKSGSRVKTLALVGGLVAIVGGTAVVGGGWLAFSKLNGGGPQPESILPADTIAFAKVDMNPSGAQKLAAVRFAMRFPDAKGKVTETSDLRKVAFEKMQEDGGFKGVHYDSDVAPWIGDRFGVGLLPGATAKDKPIAVMVLAVTDEDKAKAALPQLKGKSKTTCGVRDHFAVCSEDQTTVTLLTEADKGTTLADAPGFSADMKALGEDGVAAAWVDLGKASSLTGQLGLATGMLGTSVPDAPKGGRLAVALRFAGPSLELAGRATDMPTAWPQKRGGGTGVTDLPSGTLAAFGIDSAGDQVASSLTSSKELTRQMKQAGSELGLKLPDDLRAALGDHATVAYGGMDGDTVKVAVRTGGDPAAVSRVVAALRKTGMQEPGLRQSTAGGDPVVATTDGYARELASGGGLGDQRSFRDAVPAAKDARAVFFVDLAGLLRAHEKEMGAEMRKNLEPFSAVGISTRGEGKTAEFTVRLTTR